MQLYNWDNFFLENVIAILYRVVKSPIVDTIDVFGYRWWSLSILSIVTSIFVPTLILKGSVSNITSH